MSHGSQFERLHDELLQLVRTGLVLTRRIRDRSLFVKKSVFARVETLFVKRAVQERVDQSGLPQLDGSKLNAIVAEAQDLYGRWADLLPEEKRQIVENVVERISVGKGEVSIDLAYIPSHSEISTKQQRGHMPALPYCRATIHATWKPEAYPKNLAHIGDHLRARRLDLGLQQRDVADRLGVHAASVRNWEMGRTEPTLDVLRGVIEFLGYDPRPEPSAIGERITFWRTARGLSQEEMARRLGVDPSTLAKWESGRRVPRGPWRDVVEGAMLLSGTTITEL